MKLFVVLALVAFTDCQANVLRSDEPKPQLDLVKDAFWDYFVKATKIVLDNSENHWKLCVWTASE
uniref:Uncharacterized protein n=1 Tax=Anguilla anguilla TaxID=7936 RepID=A0A0E9UUK4_ANGAN